MQHSVVVTKRLSVFLPIRLQNAHEPFFSELHGKALCSDVSVHGKDR